MRKDLKPLSTIDSFAQWARLQRKIEQAEKDLMADRGTKALDEVKANWTIWAVQSALGLIMRILVLANVSSEAESAQCRGPWAVCFVVHRPVLWMAVCELSLWLCVR